MKTTTPTLFVSFAALLLWSGSTSPATAAPAYEPAYANGHTVLISVKDPLPGKVARQAQNKYYEVIYPIGWQSLTTSVPQCNPCDHGGDGDDFFDYHDHVFSADPFNAGGGAYGPLWRLNFVIPAITGNAQHDAAVVTLYASYLPTTSAQAVKALLAARLSTDGSPIAELIDVDYVFLAAIVNANAAH